jgi:hypothetical protein
MREEKPAEGDKSSIFLNPLNSRVDYLARFQTMVLTPRRTDGVGLMTLISSPLTVMIRFCSWPSQLGKVLPSINQFTVCSFSLATAYLP